MSIIAHIALARDMVTCRVAFAQDGVPMEDAAGRRCEMEGQLLALDRERGRATWTIVTKYGDTVTLTTVSPPSNPGTPKDPANMVEFELPVFEMQGPLPPTLREDEGD